MYYTISSSLPTAESIFFAAILRISRRLIPRRSALLLNEAKIVSVVKIYYRKHGLMTMIVFFFLLDTQVVIVKR
jgi:hypothetical protein